MGNFLSDHQQEVVLVTSWHKKTIRQRSQHAPWSEKHTTLSYLYAIQHS